MSFNLWRRRIFESCDTLDLPWAVAVGHRLCHDDGPRRQDGADVAFFLLGLGVRFSAVRFWLRSHRSWKTRRLPEPESCICSAWKPCVVDVNVTTLRPKQVVLVWFVFQEVPTASFSFHAVDLQPQACRFCMCLHRLWQWVVLACKMVDEDENPPGLVLFQILRVVDRVQGVKVVRLRAVRLWVLLSVDVLLGCCAAFQDVPSWRPRSPGVFTPSTTSYPFFLFGQVLKGWPGDSHMVHLCSLAIFATQAWPGCKSPHGEFPLFQL